MLYNPGENVTVGEQLVVFRDKVYKIVILFSFMLFYLFNF